MVESLHLFKALADEVRLRILGCLSASELSVAELVGVLDLPQSTVSRHLKPLRDVELVETRRDGTSVFYRQGAAFREPSLRDFLVTRLNALPAASADRKAVRKALDQRKRRSKDFFEQMAGKYGTLTEPGGGWPVLAAALAVGFHGQDLADLGAGEGDLTMLLARFARSVTVIDQSPSMLSHVESRAAAAGLSNKIYRAEGDLEALPLEDQSVDACFLSQALHHAAQPEHAIKEAARVLRKGGKLVLLDLVQHSHEWVREQWADQWLGFTPSEVRKWMRAAKLAVNFNEGLEGAVPELPVLFAVGTKR